MQQIQEEFAKQNRFRRISSANAYAMDKSFAPNFRSALHYYNVNHGTLKQEDKVKALMAKVEDMKDVMGRNIQLSMKRAGNLERMLSKSDDLQVDVQVFFRNSKKIKRSRQRKYWRVYATIVAVFFCVVYLLVALACGFKMHCGSSIEG